MASGLIIWWCLSCIFDTILVSASMISPFTSLKFPDVVDFASLPLLIIIFFNALPVNESEESNEFESPLLEQESENDGSFSNAGILNRLTFLWLNPLLAIGRIHKLELHHIPSIPQSETALVASSLLEEALRKQKTETSSMPKAVIHAIGRPLAVNGVLAGLSTIASYMGPLLITSFVDFLSSKREDSSCRYGLILAFIFFLGKSVESLSQRQWYFGAQCIGIQVRAALTVLIYKKSLSIKYGRMSNGNIINSITVDVERISDFFWYIHGVWLLPVQVILALIILYVNLGAAPSFAVLFTTILVMVSNTPLANMQERLYSKIMEAKDSRIKAISETSRV